MTVIQALKSIPVIARVNAEYKAWKMKHEVAVLGNQFQKKLKNANLRYESTQMVSLFHKKISDRGIDLKKIRSKQKLRLLFLGSHEGQDKSGFLQALKELFDVVELINLRGGYGQIFANQHNISNEEAIKLNTESIRRAYQEAKKQAPVDLVFAQMWANFMTVDVLQEIQKDGVIVINVAMDDRGVPALWSIQNGREVGAYGLAIATDFVFNTSKECCERYLLKNCPSLYLPLASDPVMFSPEPTKDIDVSFVGANYGIRAEIIGEINKLGIRVNAYGPGFESGNISAQEMAKVFNRSKIILGVGLCGHTRDLVTMKLRDFDSTMAGALYITTRNEDLLPLFEENKEIVFYKTPVEVAQKIKYYLEHESERESIARAATARAHRDHTWKKRLQDAFKHLEILS